MKGKCPKCGSEDIHKEYIDKIFGAIYIFAKEMVLSKINHRKTDYNKATANLSDVDSSPQYRCSRCGHTWKY